MKKKLLIAVDESIYAKYAVQYAAGLADYVKNLSYTLINIQPTISGYLLDEAKRGLKAKKELTRVQEKYRKASEKILEKYTDMMTRMGIDASDIHTISQRKQEGMAKDILTQAEKKPYDAIVLGRRGLSRFHQVFMGSLTSKILEHSQVVPVWVVDGEIKPFKFLVGVDGSEQSVKAVDHLSFILRGNSKATITLFHVLPKLSDSCKIDFSEDSMELEKMALEGDKQCIETFYVKARKQFTDAGLDPGQIEIKQAAPRMNVGKAIVDEATKRGYDTIVIGRRGIGKSFFMGSVSRHVVDRASNCALWLVS